MARTAWALVLVSFVAVAAAPLQEEPAQFAGIRNAGQYPSLQDAVDSLPPSGGVVVIPPGLYAQTIAITANKPIHLIGYGAKILAGAGQPAIKINQGMSGARGVTIDGLIVDGQNGAGTVGVELEDTNWSVLRKVTVENCATGILLESNLPGNFVEGTALQDVTVRNCSLKGIHYRRIQGTGSFGQNQMRNVAINGCAVGVHIDSGAQVYRSHFDNLTIWLQSNQKALVIDGDVNMSRFELAVEGQTGSTGNVAVELGAAATGTEHLDLELSWWGSIGRVIDNPSGLPLRYTKNRNWFSSGNIRPLRTLSHGDAQERFAIAHGFPGGAGLVLGPGNIVPDVNLYRSAADTLRTDDTFEVGGHLRVWGELSSPGDLTVRPTGQLLLAPGKGLLFESPAVQVRKAAGTNALEIVAQDAVQAQFKEPAEGEIGLLVRRNVNGSYTLQRVSVGPAGSAGRGYRVLRVPN
ncbi:MAG: hypothetical protein HYY16_17505 [Planctomycetes bacterium]|nr:hypothetical protein [Planctomycetota bacterium]